MIWNPAAPFREALVSQLSLRLCAQPGNYAIAFDHPGIRILTTPRQGALDTHLLDRNRGVVVGSIFHRIENSLDDSAAPVATFDAQATDCIVESRGRTLVSKYWGNYVAILSDQPPFPIRVLKDPTGSLPCYITHFGGISIIFSCLQDCVDIGIRSLTINWNYVASRIASNGADASHEPLSNVCSLRRGQCVEFDPESATLRSQQFYWKPVDFSEPSNAMSDADLAARTLRATVRSVTQTLVRGHADILLRLSGGLDSSIVAGCLRGAYSSRITAYVGYALAGRSDERRWARLSAQHAGFDLIECPIDPRRVDLKAAIHMYASVEPPKALTSIIRGDIEKRLTLQRHSSAQISGNGGDSVFGGESVRHVLDDFLRFRGLCFQMLSISSAVALRTDDLAWAVLAGSIRRRIRGSRMEDFRDRLMNRQSLAAKHLQVTGLRSDYFPHPWFRDYPNVPWHVISRVGALVLGSEFYDPTQRTSSEVPLELAPLYSQPVMELSLRIPLHVHFNRGIDRGLARQAFAADVPAAILRRLWKDRAPNHAEAVMQSNRVFFRDMILGGALAQARLIDCATIEGMLGGTISRGAYFVGELFALLDMELWIRRIGDSAVPSRSDA